MVDHAGVVDLKEWNALVSLSTATAAIDAIGILPAPDEGIMLVQTAVAQLNAERCLEVLWVPDHCGLMGNELADEEAKSGSAEHQPLVALDPATHRALIRRTCASNLNTTPLHTATYTRRPLQQEMSYCPSLKRPTSAAFAVATTPHYDAGRT